MASAAEKLPYTVALAPCSGDDPRRSLVPLVPAPGLRIVIAVQLFGADGRMSRAIAEAALDVEGVRIVNRAADLLIDFSAPAALAAHLERALAEAKPILIGTTGLSPDHHAAIDAAAARIAVLQAANTSLGVNLLAHLVREAAARLGPDWDIEIVEMHHRQKADAPSGTALLLGAAAAAGRNVELGAVAERGRDGITGPREPGHIGFAALRGGSVAGDHQLIFATEGERLELGHRAESRAIFARGALRAARWLHGKQPGRYTMADVLGLP
jgi:4-hydroxy-tetrahydrodipicolinate reductase